MRARDFLASRRVARWAMLFFIVFPLTAQADIPSAVVVDGQYDDWDLDKDRSTPMQKKQGCNEKILPKVYLRYDNATGAIKSAVSYAALPILPQYFHRHG